MSEDVSPSVLFVYAYMQKDMSFKSIQKTHDLMHADPRVVVLNVDGMTFDQMEAAIIKTDIQNVIINCHASGELYARLGDASDNYAGRYNLQGDDDDTKMGGMDMSNCMLMRLRKGGVTQVMLLCCHAGQIHGIEFPNAAASMPEIITIKTEYSLSFKNTRKIMECILSADHPSVTDWSFVADIEDLDSKAYHDLASAARKKKRDEQDGLAIKELEGMACFHDVQEF